MFKESDRIMNKPFLGQTPDPRLYFGYELLQKQVLNFLHQFQPLAITQHHKNSWQWILYQRHLFQLNELHLTTVDNPHFKFSCQGLPAQRIIGKEMLALDEKLRKS